MWVSIIVAVITGVFSLIGVVISNMLNHSKTEELIKTNQAVFEVKIDNLAEKVEKHNNFAARMPVVEEKLDNLERRVSKLETK